jgi:hypothetical protein
VCRMVVFLAALHCHSSPQRGLRSPPVRCPKHATALSLAWRITPDDTSTPSSAYRAPSGPPDRPDALFENKPRALRPWTPCGDALSRKHPNKTNSFFAEPLQSFLGLSGVDDKHGLLIPADLPH